MITFSSLQHTVQRRGRHCDALSLCLTLDTGFIGSESWLMVKFLCQELDVMEVTCMAAYMGIKWRVDGEILLNE